MDTTLIEIKEHVFYLCSNLLSDQQDIEENEDLFLLGLSSLDFLKILTTVENEYSITFEDDTLTNISNTFNTINKISLYIYQKIKQ
ncbi:acyl carrier protein [Staphylococcus epidermidis]|uniref:phosphopantetheine-binding protein n=1 Tax=Staphylococcus epidermidis TaxID=1282 RepID=UPI001931C428|nr:acyl carrier protein [Staphylococcus epidermidis]